MDLFHWRLQGGDWNHLEPGAAELGLSMERTVEFGASLETTWPRNLLTMVDDVNKHTI